MTRRTEPASSCSTDSLNRCNGGGDATDTSTPTLFTAAGLPIRSVTGLVGVTCSSVTRPLKRNHSSFSGTPH
ncbi:hypothetical protein BDN71DRAFT_1439301 [Pleurotus eryngii]|uniref:Uncharacterized protein n=1 Tax=Pleurotus eryngii TaxID=5323 RepID=A0A9P6AAU7_PLEER|nr:hypothetical protein BDN71DRAFT_1439301 [Pleurotus eryngii]